MFVLPEFRDARWCARVRASMDAGRRSEAEILAGDYRVDADARRAWDVEIDDETLADVNAAIGEARPRIAKFFSLPLTQNEGPGLLRYEPGGFYRSHVDCLDDEPDAWPRAISVILFLTTAAAGDGGELRVHTTDSGFGTVEITPRAGTLVAFRSTCVHEVLPVAGGVRDTIVDWLS